jgi:8-oxo-dGTP diphosphatase
MGNECSRHRARLATLAFVRNGDEILLLRRPSDSDRFAGLWNGIGGHVEAGEDIRAAARRELCEESGLDVPGLALRGVIHESGLLGQAYVVFLFVGETAQRELRASDGCELVWQPLDKLAALPLVDDVAEILPRLLATREPLFVTEAYDGRETRLSLRFDEEGVGEAVGGRV